ncbi:MAG: DNA recombination protein RmuC [Alloprevotella sp.]|nr:DNA recombination protein RmuC [Alloprevotella sp.]
MLYFFIGLLVGLLIALSAGLYFYSNQRAELSATQRELELERRHAAENKEFIEENFRQQIESTQTALQTTARKMLSESKKELSEGNKESMADITAPLRDAIKDMREDMINNSRDAARQAAGLTAEIKSLTEASHMIGERTQILAAALRGDVKKQGNWGERILTHLLEREGLKDGVEFDTQDKLRNILGGKLHNEDSGAGMLPDAILHYPNQQDVVIDAKVSLNAFYDYLSATDDKARENALKAHLRSVRDQYMRLSKKNYANYILPPRRAIEFVVMFVPNESALQLAIDADPSMWYEAFDHQVLIAGEHNLAAILRIVGIAWRQFKQAENQQRVFQVASELLDRLGDFAQRYAKIGDSIDTLRNNYDFASKKLIEGRQSVVKKGNELKKMGVKENPARPIPPALPDVADLLTDEPE